MSTLANMTRREKILAAGVGSVLFILLNLFLLSFFFGKQATLRADLAIKQDSFQTASTLLSERELWTKRDAWLRAKQPKLVDESGAGVELLNEIKDAAKKSDATLENPAIGTTQKTPGYRSVPVNVETKSSWESLIKFLHEVQKPDQFIVLESANIQIDSADQTKMHGHFKIARWYAAQ
jgi:Tfp pilus assembly protein PilO